MQQFTAKVEFRFASGTLRRPAPKLGRCWRWLRLSVSISCARRWHRRQPTRTKVRRPITVRRRP